MSDPFRSLLDLDQGYPPVLRLRLGGEEYPLRAPEALPMADAFRLGELFEQLSRKRRARARSNAVVRKIVAIVAPGLPVTLSQTQAWILVAFYSGHLTDAVVGLTTPAGVPVPFSAPARGSSPRPASARASASDCGSSSPCR